jgi:hypothetical protein
MVAADSLANLLRREERNYKYIDMWAPFSISLQMKYLFFTVFLCVSCLAGHAKGESIFVVQAKDVFTNTAQLELITALAETNFNRADDILKNLPVDTRSTNGGTALWWEANTGNFDAFSYLLRKGQAWSCRHRCGKYP